MRYESIVHLRTLVWKDIVIELRRKSELWVSASFTLAVSVLVSSGLYNVREPGWGGGIGAVLTALFIALFTGYSIFTRESVRGTFDGLRVSPVGRWVVVAAKIVVISLFIFPHLLVFSILVYVFTPGFTVDWPSYLLWTGATVLFLSSATALVSSMMSFGEMRAGPMTMTILVLSIPYLRIALDALGGIFGGFSGMHALASLWVVASFFTVLSLVLGDVVLE